MSVKIFPVPKKSNLVPLISEEKYSELYRLSIDNPKEFWGEQALSRLNWITPFDDVLSTNMEKAKFEWFSNGKLNACLNCVDKHLENNGNDIAFIWESDDGSTSKKITYNELYEEVCRLSNLLKSELINAAIEPSPFGTASCIDCPLIFNKLAVSFNDITLVAHKAVNSPKEWPQTNLNFCFILILFSSRKTLNIAMLTAIKAG